MTNLTDYGCFVEIEEGVEGLVHVSEMDWTNKNIHPSKVVNVGDVVARTITSTTSPTLTTLDGWMFLLVQSISET